jgi:hypothetical protein
MTKDELREWQERNNLSTEEAATILGLSKRSYEGLRAGRPIMMQTQIIAGYYEIIENLHKEIADLKNTKKRRQAAS